MNGTLASTAPLSGQLVGTDATICARFSLIAQSCFTGTPPGHADQWGVLGCSDQQLLRDEPLISTRRDLFAAACSTPIAGIS
jgi:hypothetical protein